MSQPLTAMHGARAGAQVGDAPPARVRRGELVQWLGELSDLLAAGCPLARGLKVMARQSPSPRVKALSERLEAEIVNGASLAEALSASGSFSRVHVAMVRAAEAGGFLRQTLAQMAAQGRRRMELVGRIRSALTYPAVLMATALASVVFLLSYVVPSFTAVYRDAGVDLPGPTRLLMAMSDFLTAWWPLLLGVLISAVGVLRLLSVHEGFRRSFDALALRVPVIGTVAHQWALSEFSRVMAMLLGGGVRALDALMLSASAVGNRAMRSAVRELAEAVQSGRPLGRRMTELEIFPQNISELVSIAEESGRLPEVMTTLAEQSYSRFSARVEVMVTLIEPAIVILVAAVVALVVAAMLLPVLMMNTLVN